MPLDLGEGGEEVEAAVERWRGGEVEAEAEAVAVVEVEAEAEAEAEAKVEVEVELEVGMEVERARPGSRRHPSRPYRGT